MPVCSSDFSSQATRYLDRSGSSGQNESHGQIAPSTSPIGPEQETGLSALVGRLRRLYDGESAIPEIVARGVAAVPSLEALLRGPSEALYHSRCWAADALARIGGDAISALTRALRDSGTRVLPPVLQEAEDVVVYRVAEHLTLHPQSAVTEALLEALRHRPNSGCVRALGRLASKQAIPDLVHCLSEDATRSAAVAALREMGPTCTLQLARLVADNTSPNSVESPSHVDGRAVAAGLLGEWLNCSQPEMVARNSLTLALADPQRRVRIAAAIALSQGDTRDVARAFPLLIDALDDPDWRQAETIMSTLRGLAPRTSSRLAFEVMHSALGESARRRRRRAISLLGSLSSPATQRLLACLADDYDQEMRLTAVWALATNQTCSIELLTSFLADPYFAVRRVVFSALRRRKALSAEIAIRFLGDPEKTLRRLALSSLRKNEPRAREALVRAVLKFGEPRLGLKARSRQWWHSCWLLILA
jgi:HEAT repeat protein